MERLTPEEQQRRSRLARLAQAARDELPRAAQSGLTTSLIAGAQPQNALADRRIYQPPLASMQAMNPEPEPGLRNALEDIYADPRRMLPGSGGWTEGVGAAAPHLAAAALDFVNPAGFAGRAGSIGKRVVAESGNAASQMRLPAVKYAHPAAVPPRGSIDPHFAPTGATTLPQRYIARLNKVVPPVFKAAYHNAGVSLFQKAIASGNIRRANELLEVEARRYERRVLSTPETDALYDYMVDVMDARPFKLTRQAPGTIRSSNSNAPTLGGGQQPDPYAPTLSPRRPQ